ncbi:MAG: hypothetical protein D6798_17630, partial [Deltaproteobacteria bacterium]
PPDELLAELSEDLSPAEAQAVAGQLVGVPTIDPTLRRTLARRFVLPLQGADCVTGARALLGTRLIDDDLALRLRRCHHQHPELYADVLEAVEAGELPVDNLLPMPPSLDDDTRLRVQRVAADALRAAAPSEREGPFRVLMGASGGNPRQGPRHVSILTLPEGGAAVAIPTPCQAEGAGTEAGGFELRDGTMVLAPLPAGGDPPLRVELLDPEQAIRLARIVCGDDELWRAPPR